MRHETPRLSLRHRPRSISPTPAARRLRNPHSSGGASSVHVAKLARLVRGPPDDLFFVMSQPETGINRAPAGAATVLEKLVVRVPGMHDPARQSTVLQETGHRPWNLPNRPWFMA